MDYPSRRDAYSKLKEKILQELKLEGKGNLSPLQRTLQIADLEF